MNNFRDLLQCLEAAKVEFILVDGVAAVVHGSSRLTQHLDIVYRRTADNIDRLVRALAPLHPYLRGAPAGLPFEWNRETVERGLNFTLITDLGAIDVFGEITGNGTYERLASDALRLNVFGIECLCLSLHRLIEAKRAAGRPKDFEALAELESLVEKLSGGN